MADAKCAVASESSVGILVKAEGFRGLWRTGFRADVAVIPREPDVEPQRSHKDGPRRFDRKGDFQRA